MSNLIQRNRYFDGEFLRSFDFNDEQTYNVAIRRRLNRSLHLYGIVEGLQLVSDVQAGITQISITPGVAIDAFGREIFMFAPYTLGNADLSANRITGNPIVDVWIRYKKTAGTLPSTGYGLCNDPNQFTRWQESYSVVLVVQNTVLFSDPEFVDADTDDPLQDQVGVFLGSVSVNQSSVTSLFANPAFDDRRVFVGDRVQRLRPPLDPTAAGTVPYPVLDANTALSPATSLAVESNLFAEQNLIVGDDFNIKLADISPAPTGTYPPQNANGYVQGIVKVAGDLFANGNVYSFSKDKGKWLPFSEIAKQFMPELLTGQSSVVPTGPFTPGMVSGTETISLTSTKFAKLGSVVPFAFLSAIQFLDVNTFNGFTAGMPQVAITSVGQSLGPPNQCNVSVGWTVGPCNATLCAIKTFTVNVVVVCYP